jgi:hypothetical protein
MTNKKGRFCDTTSLQIELPLKVYTVHPIEGPLRLVEEVQ